MIIQDELLPTTLYFNRKCIKAKQGNLNCYIWVHRVYALVNYFGSRMEQYHYYVDGVSYC